MNLLGQHPVAFRRVHTVVWADVTGMARDTQTLRGQISWECIKADHGFWSLKVKRMVWEVVRS